MSGWDYRDPVPSTMGSASTTLTYADIRKAIQDLIDNPPEPPWVACARHGHVIYRTFTYEQRRYRICGHCGTTLVDDA